MAKKCLLIVLDGLGDRSFSELGSMTPLQAADTPFLDTIAAAGSNGLYHPSRHGRALPSEKAHFSMFGYRPDEFPGRGALEALGAGIPLNPGDVAVLCHVASVRESNGTLVVVHEAPDCTTAEAETVSRLIERYHTQGVTLTFHPTKGLFGILVLEGMVSPWVTDTNLMQEGQPVPVPKPWQEYASDVGSLNTAAALKAFITRSYKLLSRHPLNRERTLAGAPALNCFITQRAGRLKEVEPFKKRHGLKGLSISSGTMYAGLCTYIGLDCKSPSGSHDPETDIMARLKMACDALPDYDFIHVHTKAPDEAAHTKRPEYKREVIAALDRGIAAGLESMVDNPDLLIVVTADHSTPSGGSLVHSGEPVPLTMYGCGTRRDSVVCFDEIQAASGCLGCVRGEEILYLVLNYLDRAVLEGIRTVPEELTYTTDDYEPLKL